jgi:ribosomal protein L16/L10AE
MGKGKGDMQRWTIRVRCGLLFMEFKGFTFKKIATFKELIQKKLIIRLTTVTNQT